MLSDPPLPPAISATVGEPWFVAIDIIGTIAFAISGLVLARRGGYSLFGAFVLAALPAVGGGIMRDLIFSREPLGCVRTPVYLVAILATVTSGYLGIRCYERWFRCVFDRLVG